MKHSFKFVLKYHFNFILYWICRIYLWTISIPKSLILNFKILRWENKSIAQKWEEDDFEYQEKLNRVVLN